MTQDNSMLSKWNRWYVDLNRPQPYGDTKTYLIGETYLKNIDVEDWGCGKGFFKSIHDGGYKGIDGTATPFTDIVVDLVEYQSNTRGIFMRHVLEHNLNWQAVLHNAVISFTEIFVLILFTPMVNKTQQIAWNDGVEVPDIAFSHKDIINELGNCLYDYEDYITKTQYGTERIYVITK